MYLFSIINIYEQKYCSGKGLILLETNRNIQKSGSYMQSESVVAHFSRIFFKYTGLKKILERTIFFWKNKKKTLFLFIIFFLAVGGIGKAFTIIKLVGNGAQIKKEPSSGFYELIKVKNSLSIPFTIVPDYNNNSNIIKKA